MTESDAQFTAAHVAAIANVAVRAAAHVAAIANVAVRAVEHDVISEAKKAADLSLVYLRYIGSSP